MIPSNFQGIFILGPNNQNSSASGKKINHKQFISCSHLSWQDVIIDNPVLI
ncbi:Uncharacterised protein [Alcaligenes faecalis]|nr:hypothetical protein AFA2_03007 [Alcaligenes faecalis subsp. faecalis NBRC 13111]CUI91510.1 Uncharacterised protein [Alcaligenes faecalis]